MNMLPAISEKQEQQKLNNLLPKNFIRNLLLKGIVCFLWKKWLCNLEGYPKKWMFASHGDFRRYLYEALVMSMPTH
jgi:hypothetical protein